MRACLAIAVLARALGRMPAGRQPVGRGHRQHADAASVLAQQPGRLDRLGRHRPGVDDGKRAAGLGPAQPIAAVDDLIAQLARHGRASWSSGRVERRRYTEPPFSSRCQRLLAVLVAVALHVVEAPTP